MKFHQPLEAEVLAQPKALGPATWRAELAALIQPWLKHLMACKMGINIPYYSGWWFGTWLL